MMMRIMLRILPLSGVQERGIFVDMAPLVRLGTAY